MSLLKSRFIEMFIEKRYPTASLDELSICGGEYGAQSSAIEYHPNRPRYVRITDINEDGSLNNDYASSANIKDDEQYRLKYGDFLFARMGATVGKTYAYTFGDQIYAGYLIRYRLNLEKILPEYLFAFTRLNCYWKWVSINQNGAAQPGINAKKYGSLYVPVPPIEEQKKFIELSQQIDKSKFLLQQILKKLELLKKSRFIEMFIEKRYPTASLDELSICGGEYGAQSSAIEYHPNRPRYVRITDINEDGSLNNDYASSANIKDDEQYRLKYGDFLFARMGATVGKTYAYTFGDQIYAGYLIRYRLNLEKILPEYLFAFTRLNCYWKWVSINQNGAAQPGINAKKYGSLYVPVPPIEEQKKFIELSQQIDKSKLIIQKALENLVGKV